MDLSSLGGGWGGPEMEWAGLTRTDQYHERNRLLGLLHLLYILPAHRKRYLTKHLTQQLREHLIQRVNLSWADGGSEEGGDDAFKVSALAWKELIGVLDGPESVCAFFEGLPPRFGVVVDGRLPRFPAEEDSPSGVLKRSAQISKGGQTGASLRRRWVITGRRGSRANVLILIELLEE